MTQKYIVSALAVLGGIVLILLSSSLYTVHQTQFALVLQFGRPVKALLEPGLYLKIPFIQNVEYFNARIQNVDPPAQEILLIDQKRINVDAFLRYRIVDPLEFRKKAVTSSRFIQVFGGRLNSAVRAEIAKVSLVDILADVPREEPIMNNDDEDMLFIKDLELNVDTAKESDAVVSVGRVGVMNRITELMQSQEEEFGIKVVDVRIGRTDLPDTTKDSVFQRMSSERKIEAEQLRAEGVELANKIQAAADRERTVILADANRESEIERGRGDAERNMIFSSAYKQAPEFYNFFRTLQAWRVSFDNFEKVKMVLSPESEFFRYFNGIEKENNLLFPPEGRTLIEIESFQNSGMAEDSQTRGETAEESKETPLSIVSN